MMNGGKEGGGGGGGGIVMSKLVTNKIKRSITELVGRTPLLEIVNYEKENQLEAEIIGKLEYLNPAKIVSKTELQWQ